MGKWHLGQRRAYLPASHGFDEFLGLPYSVDEGMARTSSCEADGTAGATDLVSTGRRRRLQFGEQDGDAAEDFLPLISQMRQGEASREGAPAQVLEQPADLTTLADKFVSFARGFISSHAAEPFFLYVSFAHVHIAGFNQVGNQYSACRFKGLTRRGGFGDALAEVDWMVGQVVKELERQRLSENTLLLFTGDNGPWMDRATAAGSAGLFQGRYSGYYNVGKGSTWEGGIREPGFAYWPGQVAAQTRTEEIVSTLDFLPTLAELAGVRLPTDRIYDGQSIVPTLLAPAPPASASPWSGYDDLYDELGASSSAAAGSSYGRVLFFYGGGDDGATPTADSGGRRVVLPTAANTRPTAARIGPYKAHFVTGPGLGGCGCVAGIKLETDKCHRPAAPAGCPFVSYDVAPLIFQIEHDPSEAHPLVSNNTLPRDPARRALVDAIWEAYDAEVLGMRPYTAPMAPEEPGEGPGKFGVCCDRNKGDTCMCTGEPDPGWFPTHGGSGAACTPRWIAEDPRWQGDPLEYPDEPICQDGF